MAVRDFKVIVVGGGPVGLTAAHALEKAGIDFIVLERRPDVVIDAGSNLVLSPIGLLTLERLGLLTSISAVSSPLSRIDRLDHKGRDIGDVNIFQQMSKDFGMSPRIISRHDLTKVLYESLTIAARQRILTDRKLCNITVEGSNVVAHCADGSCYRGATVLGADGAHSSVRDLMRTVSLSVGSSQVNAELPFLTTYRAMWIRFPRPSTVLEGATCETHGRDAATQLFAGKETGVIGIYDRLQKPTRQRIRHTQADQYAFIDRWGHLPVTANPHLTLRDIWESRLEAGLVSLEEGIVDHWSWAGCIVLVGDAAHKFTPSTGAGCINGMVDVITLVNELDALTTDVQATPGFQNGAPPRAEIASAFASYQKKRQADVMAEYKISSLATGTATWHSGIHKFIDQHVMSHHSVQKYLFHHGPQSRARSPNIIFEPNSEEAANRRHEIA